MAKVGHHSFDHFCNFGRSVSSAYTGGVDQIVSGFYTSDEYVIWAALLFVLGVSAELSHTSVKDANLVDGSLSIPYFGLRYAYSSFMAGKELFFALYGALTAFDTGAAGAQVMFRYAC